MILLEPKAESLEPPGALAPENLRTAGSARARIEGCSTRRYRSVAPANDIASAITLATAIVACAPSVGPHIWAVFGKSHSMNISWTR